MYQFILDGKVQFAKNSLDEMLMCILEHKTIKEKHGLIWISDLTEGFTIAETEGISTKPTLLQYEWTHILQVLSLGFRVAMNPEYKHYIFHDEDIVDIKEINNMFYQFSINARVTEEINGEDIEFVIGTDKGQPVYTTDGDCIEELLRDYQEANKVLSLYSELSCLLEELYIIEINGDNGMFEEYKGLPLWRASDKWVSDVQEEA